MTVQSTPENDVMAKVRADTAIGLLSVLLGIATVVYSLTLPSLGAGRPGPGLFPGIVGAALVLFGLTLATQAVLRGRKAKRIGPALGTLATGTPAASAALVSDSAEPEITPKRAMINTVVVLLAIVGFILLAEPLGFLLTMFLLSFVIMVLLRAKLVTALVTSAVLSVIMWGVFEKLLLVQLPDGLLV